MTKFTPGPWQKSYAVRDGGWDIKGADGWMVGDAFGRNQKEDEANARLIAAAPELYAALKEAIPYMDHGDFCAFTKGMDFCDCYLGEMRQTAQAALALVDD